MTLDLVVHGLLEYQEQIYRVKKREIQKSGLDGILKGPGKLARCVVWWLQTSYPGALTPPLIPTFCTDKLYKRWGGRARVNPTWVKTPGVHQTSHISFSPSYISFIHLSIYIVARHHFHERVGESPRREKNFGTNGYKIRRFVSEIWSFEVGIAVRTNSTCKI